MRKPTPTRRLYLQPAPPLVAAATVTAVERDAVAVDRSPFYPGGGLPCDTGVARLAGRDHRVTEVFADAADRLWHRCDPPPGADAAAGRWPATTPCCRC